MSYDSINGLKGYVNGALDGSAAANGNAAVNAVADIGQDNQNAGRFWNGSIDELRISANNPRGADWITATYNNHKSGSTFISHGGQTPAGQIPSMIFAWS